MGLPESLMFSFLLDGSAAFASGFALSTALLTLLTMSEAFEARWANRHEIIQILATVILGVILAMPFANLGCLILVALVVFFSCVGLRAVLQDFSVAGVCYTLQAPLIIISGVWWYLAWITTVGFSGWYFFVFALLPVLNATEAMLDYVLYMGTYSLLIRKVWREPFGPAISSRRVLDSMPFVSVHVPCHAEPPSLVISTIEALSRLEYQNYEVLVCDNNTNDASLWRPVEARCNELNAESGKELFRFFHIEELKGAKAGALNYCLDITDPRAIFIAIVDADYIADSSFLCRLAPHFDDPELDFIQTSHDYYDGKKNLFNQLCYWEYLLGTKFSMAGLNELHAAFTIGTMCILRLKAVEDAGRWAEWCLTEDSEIAVRLRARGGKGRYFRDTFGRGTTPDTFVDWKRQRFRWTAGPVQQLLAHWRLFLPQWLGGSSGLSGWSKVFETVRSIQMLSGIITLAGVMMVATAMLLLPPQIPAERAGLLPALGFFIAFALSTSSLVLTGIGYWLAGCRSYWMMSASMWAGAALTYTRMLATAAALLKIRLLWKRTPKFSANFGRMRALGGTLVEILFAALFLILIVMVIMKANEIGWLAVLISAGGLIRFFLSFLAAPLMALISANSEVETIK